MCSTWSRDTRDSRRSSEGAKMWQRGEVTSGPALLHGWRVGPASGLPAGRACVLVPAGSRSFPSGVPGSAPGSTLLWDPLSAGEAWVAFRPRSQEGLGTRELWGGLGTVRQDPGDPVKRWQCCKVRLRLPQRLGAVPTSCPRHTTASLLKALRLREVLLESSRLSQL